MKSGRARRLWLARATCLAWFAIPIVAPSPVFAQPSEDGLKVMTYSRKTTEPGCIGRPVTPLCAVETSQACFNWGEPALCRRVGEVPFRARWKVDDYWSLGILRYKPAGERLLTDTDIPDWARALGRQSWKAGDLVYDVWFQTCRPSDDCVRATRNDPSRKYGEGCPANECSWDTYPNTYILRQNKQSWRVVYLYRPDLAGPERPGTGND